MPGEFSLQLLVRIVVVTALALLAVWTLWNFLPALGWAAVLAIATWPLRQHLVRNAVHPSYSAILLTLLIGLLILGPLVIVVTQGAREAVLVLKWLREVGETGLGTPEWLSEIPLMGGYLASWWQDNLADPDAAKELLGRSESMPLMEWSRHVGHELIHRLVILGFTLLTLFFIYRDGPHLMEQMHTIADRLLGPPARRYAREVFSAVRATLNGLVLVGLAEGAVLGVVYALLGLRHPILLGFATGVLAAIPFGAPLVYTVASLILAMQSRVTAAVVLFLFASALVFVADHFVRPALIGRSTRLPFLFILLGIFGGLETFGLLGLFLGPALMAVMLAIFREGAHREQGHLSTAAAS
jgi:predicted PurR-regulated permease PerM